MKEQVEAVLAKIRPSLQADGGDVELVAVTDAGVVQVKLTGACKGCPMGSGPKRYNWARMLPWDGTSPVTPRRANSAKMKALAFSRMRAMRSIIMSVCMDGI